MQERACGGIKKKIKSSFGKLDSRLLFNLPMARSKGKMGFWLMDWTFKPPLAGIKPVNSRMHQDKDAKMQGAKCFSYH